ncbi:MAG TPA: carbon-nitrogen hydrolase family protein [Pseudolysinimonas sp.]|nr:carbon-nitrogen hydrolase family protein [Pseudolysinimonas sp.]
MAYLNVAILQAIPESDDPSWEVRRDANLAGMATLVKKVKMSNPLVDLAVFPEYYLAGLKGLVAPDSWPRDMAETLDGPLVQAALKIARDNKIWLIPGTFAEISDDPARPYNVALLISPEGDIKLSYRKTFIPYPLEQSSAGFDYPVYEIPGIGKIGIAICADSSWPESIRNLALNGAEVIIRPNGESDWILGRELHEAMARVRAFENQLYFLDVNTAGPMGLGESLVVDPEGRVLQKLGPGELWTVAYLNLDEVRRVREQGSSGLFPMLKILKETKQSGHDIDACYVNGIENAPVYKTHSQPTPRTPAEIKRLW